MKRNETSAAKILRRRAKPMPEMGKAVYQITEGPKEHKHSYYCINPWSPDGKLLLLARYDRKNPVAEICVMDVDTGKISVVGNSTKWNSHTTALQQWQGSMNRILYFSSDKNGTILKTVNPDGSSEKSIPFQDFIPEAYCSPDGKYTIGSTSFGLLFPNNQIAPRKDKGLFRIDLETGKRKLILSLQDVLDLLPAEQKQALANYHFFIKRALFHPTRSRILFNLTNHLWDIDGAESRISILMAAGTDGSNPVYLGRFTHHPNRNPLDNRVLANLRDCNQILRLGIYRDKSNPDLVEYVPLTRGSGHPSFSPDGKWICADGAGPKGNQIVICDPISGKHTVVEESDSLSGQYSIVKAVRERSNGKTVMDAISQSEKIETWVTQAHASWSRDGSAILFNIDKEKGSQIYMVDVEEALK